MISTTEETAAVIDMGTNTFHLLLAKWGEDGVSIFYREKSAVKIGKGGISRGVIAPDAFERAVNAIIHFKEVMNRHNVQKVYAVATSAVRSARNGKELAEEIFSKTGIEIHIITGEKEAELIYRGVKFAIDLGMNPSLVMDIGGGSVEFILCNADRIFWKGSFEIGAQRLVDLFHRHEPITSEEARRLINYLDDKLTPLFAVAEDFKPLTLIGSSGSFDTLCDIDLREQGLTMSVEEEKEYSMSISTFEKISKEIVSKSKQDRLQIPGMIEMRVDMIVVACLLTEHIIHRLSVSKIRVSTYALKEGVLSKLILKEVV